MTTSMCSIADLMNCLLWEDVRCIKSTLLHPDDWDSNIELDFMDKNRVVVFNWHMGYAEEYVGSENVISEYKKWYEEIQ